MHGKTLFLKSNVVGLSEKNAISIKSVPRDKSITAKYILFVMEVGAGAIKLKPRFGKKIKHIKTHIICV